MKKLFSLFAIGVVFILSSCKTENPVSTNYSVESPAASSSVSPKALSSTNDTPMNITFTASSSYSKFFNSSVLEIIGNGWGAGIGNNDLYSYSKILSGKHSGSFEIIKNNKSKLIGTLTGTAYQVKNILNVYGTYKITGSAGSYADTKGEGKYTGKIDLTNSTGKILFNGIISQPGIIRE